MQPAQPAFVNSIQKAVRKSRAAIAAAFYEAFYCSWEDGCGEVAGLIRFFTELPELQNGLNSILGKHHVTAELKGVFCHKAGNSGPVVKFNIPSAGAGCELSDLLLLITYSDNQGGVSTGNAIFLQAKLNRESLTKRTGASTKRQMELYELAPQFTFTYPERYVHSPTDDPADGSRIMPGASTTGFCYWSFSTEEQPMDGRRRNSSSLSIPASVSDLDKDIPFGEAMASLLDGSFGLSFNSPALDEYGWNRIVFDVVLRAMKETLSCSAGIANVKDLPRIEGAHALESYLKQGGDLAFVANPFDILAKVFGNSFLNEVVDTIHNEPRMSGEEVDRFIKARMNGDGPPNEKFSDEESGGGGSFIHINLKFEPERKPPHLRKRKMGD